METIPADPRAVVPVQATSPSGEAQRNTISVSTTRLITLLSVIGFVLVAMSLAAASLSVVRVDDAFMNEARESFVRLFLLDLEHNVPAWFSSVLLLSCSFLLLTIAFVHSRSHRPYVSRWFLLSLIFGCLSLDESVELHEMSIKPVRSALDTTGYFHFAWVIPGAIAVAILALVYLGFLRALPRKTRRLCVIAGIVYVGGALIIESMSGMQASIHGRSNLTYQAISTLEEMFEIGGLVIFFYGLLDYIDHELKNVSFLMPSERVS